VIVITLALGSRLKQRGCKVTGQEEGSPKVKANALQGCGPRGRKPESEGKCIARLQAKRKDARESRQKHCKVASQEEGSLRVKAKALQGCGLRGSWGVTSHTPGSVKECEGVNTHTPKATPTLGDGVPVDSRNFRE